MAMRGTFVPTGRAALLVAACAPAALLLAVLVPGAWAAAPALGTLVLLAVMIDALLAGSASEVRLTEPGDVEVGAEAEFAVAARFTDGWQGTVEAAVSADPRLVAGGRTEQALTRGAGRDWRAAIGFRPVRRGTGAVDGLWLRWTGPLGLGARQLHRVLDQPVRVWPNLAAVRSPALQTFLKDAQFGLIARRMRGEGTVFEALSEYQPGMDRRRIDWKSSARHAHLYAKEFEAERNNQIVFAFDCGQSMCEPVEGLPRIDRAVSAALATAYVALKGGDKVALFGFAARPELFTPFVTDAREFPRLQQAAAGLDYHAQEPNFTLALATLAGRLARRSLIVVFSDFTDPTSAELMIESIGRLTSRHLVIFVTLRDEELDSIAQAPPEDLQALAMATTADALLRQRALVLSRLRQLGVDVVEAPHGQIGTRLIDQYLTIKRKGAIG
ncbi:DUF58 domain-containing protein [Novosphingobium sp.]|uniref:DUF58 domain-containing protein n=1 Tax=Novosphingobium sp. TaxID=1874826 RepID=UPI001EC968A2|nr:DUF58 domain-containing protein [Novosphingobium sp.]MBK6803059.1 DUF58 domain-containing protein [Novosphingobium sp.]MBK9012092.1 DUF58 domain-containing protein [Novosphingobium sp.]